MSQQVQVVVSGATPTGTQWDPVRRAVQILGQNVKNTNTDTWSDVLRLSSSVMPKVLVPALGMAAWAALVAVFHIVKDVNFLKTLGLPNSMILISVLGTAMGLLLVFRVNTAYDRFWEGRKVWSIVHFQCRNLARFIWVYVQPKSVEEAQQQKGAMNLLIAFPAALKHALREEPGHRWADLGPYVQHIKDFGADVQRSTSGLIIPIEVLVHLQSYVNRYPAYQFPASNAIAALADAVSNLQRVRTTPIPAAYTLHLKQTLIVYLLSLPFQIVVQLQWFTIPVTFFSALIMLGIEVIGGEIENPFGFDNNDLPQDDYCDAIAREISQIMAADDPTADAFGWIQPFSLNNNKVDSQSLKVHMQAALEASVLRKETGQHHWVESLLGKIVSVMQS
ncbi:hypothetical protein HDU78_005261 [Chytriomyces hyalinus]|nr:hypothetical protein HDU78_005261 [Chytriomyces hyalinus]KAJ3249746.1 hypothetical protein HDU77_007516 [Chytriomyces hyalinus]